MKKTTTSFERVPRMQLSKLSGGGNRHALPNCFISCDYRNWTPDACGTGGLSWCGCNSNNTCTAI